MQLYGKWARWGRYNLFFEAFKGLLLKIAPYFFLFFAENVTLLSLNIIKLIPYGASTSKYKNFAFPMWLYEGVELKKPCSFTPLIPIFLAKELLLQSFELFFFGF